jgi:hypothetical protein
VIERSGLRVAQRRGYSASCNPPFPVLPYGLVRQSNHSISKSNFQTITDEKSFNHSNFTALWDEPCNGARSYLNGGEAQPVPITLWNG